MTDTIFALKVFLSGVAAITYHRLIHWRHAHPATCASDMILFTIGLFLMLFGGIFAIWMEW